MKRKIFMDPNVPKNIPKSTNSLYWDGASDVMTIEIWFKNLIRADSIEELREITIPKEDKTSRKKIKLLFKQYNIEPIKITSH
jgi:hypothetical protein